MTEPALHSICPKCHLPIRKDDSYVLHEGHRYHSRCAPVPEAAGKKDNPYEPVIGI